MTMTPTNQTPRECKHFNNGKCGCGPHVIDGCIITVWCIGINCPDYHPNEKKDGSRTDYPSNN